MWDLVNLVKWEVRTTSNLIWEEFWIAHKHILEKINKFKDENNSFNPIKSTFKNSYNRTFENYILTIKEALQLIFIINNKKAVIFNSMFLLNIENNWNIEESFYSALEDTKEYKNYKWKQKTYIVKKFWKDVYKIWRTSQCIKNRLKVIQTWSEDYLWVYLVINEDIELKLHNKFKNQNIWWEWFNLKSEDIHQIYLENKNISFYEYNLEWYLSDLEHYGDDFNYDILRKLNIKQLKEIDTIIKKEMLKNTHYKEIYLLCKIALENFAGTLYLDEQLSVEFPQKK